MLTGKTRHREHKRFLGPSLLVMQVEVGYREWDRYDICFHDRTFWRDATVEDLTMIQEARKAFEPAIAAMLVPA